MKKFAAVLIAASSALAAPAFAQDGSITLRVDSGSVMTSAGGEYESASTGKQLAVGERVMVNAGSSATVLYAGGCAVEFKEPGVYYGQCSELCGARHGYMPIVVEALPRDKFNAWVIAQGGKIDGAPDAPAAAPVAAASPAAAEKTGA